MAFSIFRGLGSKAWPV